MSYIMDKLIIAELKHNNKESIIEIYTILVHE